MCPTADAMYACDEHWWDYYYHEIAMGYGGQLWTQDVKAAKKYNLQYIQGESSRGLGRDRIHFGGNSGYQAMNLAYLFGVKKIVLLGFDMQMTDGKQHYFGNHPYHPKPNQGPRTPQFMSWRPHFEHIARDLKKEGVQVVNATRKTALTCFYMGDIATC